MGRKQLWDEPCTICKKAPKYIPPNGFVQSHCQGCRAIQSLEYYYRNRNARLAYASRKNKK